MEKTPQRPNDDWARASLRDAIDATGLTVSTYATTILVRTPSTVYRWLNGQRPVPKVVREFLIGDWRILGSDPE